MRYLVVIPTIRQRLPGFDENMARLRQSFTHPTELAILDGKDGKAQTLNKAYDTHLKAIRHDVYVTMDDDYLPVKGWQDALAEGFRLMPRCGVLGLWLGEEQAMLDYANAEHSLPPEAIGGITVRRMMQDHSIPGCMIAFRRKVAIKVGKTPTGGVKFQFYEDGYRCVRAWTSGWTVAYVDMRPVPTIYHYPDPKDYQESKRGDIESSEQIYESFLHEAARKPLLARVIDKLKR